MKYKIFIVDSSDIDIEEVGSGSEDELGFAEIRDLAINSFESDKLSKCLQFMVSTVNNSVPDYNFYFVCDYEEEIILFY